MARPFVSMKVTGGRALNKKLERVTRGMRGRAIRNGMKEAMKPVLALAQQRAPVGKTGNLKKGIRIAVFNKRWLAGAQVQTGTRKQMKIPADSKHYYPAYVEYGTRHRRPKPFLRNSLHDRRSQVLGRVVRDVTAALDRISRSK